MADSGSKFTFLNYDSPHHSASHRKKVKAHISSKYRTTVRQLGQPRYALPQRYLHTSQLTLEPRSESENGTTTGARKKRKQRQDLVIATEELGRRTPSLLAISFRGTRVDPFTPLPGQETPTSFSHSAGKGQHDIKSHGAPATRRQSRPRLEHIKAIPFLCVMCGMDVFGEGNNSTKQMCGLRA